MTAGMPSVVLRFRAVEVHLSALAGELAARRASGIADHRARQRMLLCPCSIESRAFTPDFSVVALDDAGEVVGYVIGST